VWTALSSLCQLSVGLLADNEPNRRWTAELPDRVDAVRVRAVAAHWGEQHLYFLTAAALKRRNPDVVILPGWENPAAWQVLVEAKLKNVACIAFYESSLSSHRFARGPVAFVRRLFFRHVDAVVTTGEASSQAVRGFGVPRGLIIQTQNAVDVTLFRAAAQNESARGSAERSRCFLYVGQLIARKNVDGLLRAFATLDDDAELVIVGEGSCDGSLRQLASELGVESRVHMLGYVDPIDLPTQLARAGTLVLPSRREVYGLVVNEALASGLHVVVSTRAGVHVEVAHMEGVYSVEPEPVALARSMRDSANDWRGPVTEPAILARTPEAMAKDVLRATFVARSARPQSAGRFRRFGRSRRPCRR
jgi:glycosyltransferase involved in cell wall biosynthesis